MCCAWRSQQPGMLRVVAPGWGCRQERHPAWNRETLGSESGSSAWVQGDGGPQPVHDLPITAVMQNWVEFSEIWQTDGRMDIQKEGG